MRAIVKRPGEPPEVQYVANELEALQTLVGGYIEGLTLRPGVVLICNEEGRLQGLPQNALGIVGTLLIVGAQDEAFTDLRERDAESLMHVLGGRTSPCCDSSGPKSADCGA